MHPARAVMGKGVWFGANVQLQSSLLDARGGAVHAPIERVAKLVGWRQ